MADSQATPLSSEERAELEALRAEKAKREKEERARAERTELEALRAEQTRAQQNHAGSANSVKQHKPQPQQQDDSKKSFGVRMVTSDTVNNDGIPTMPVAQKVIIAICLIAVIAFALYNLL